MSLASDAEEGSGKLSVASDAEEAHKKWQAEEEGAVYQRPNEKWSKIESREEAEEGDWRKHLKLLSDDEKTKERDKFVYQGRGKMSLEEACKNWHAEERVVYQRRRGIKWSKIKSRDEVEEEVGTEFPKHLKLLSLTNDEELRSSFMSGWSWIPLDDIDGESNKSLYFCLRECDWNRRSFRCNWYIIDFKEDGNSCPECLTTLSPVIETMPHGVPETFTAVAFGSRIYLIGGLSGVGTIFHDSVFYYDTAQPHQGWKDGPSMITARAQPSVVVAFGKIYVFGGMSIYYKNKKKPPYAEVLDPTLDRWEELPEPPQDDLPDFSLDHVHTLLSDDCGNRHILIQSLHARAFISFNIDTGAWDLIKELFCDNRSVMGVEMGVEMGVALNGVLYCCVGCNVYAYDLLKGKRNASRVRGFENRKDSFQPDKYYPFTYFFHIGGGKLCLFWSSMDHVTVVCTIFTVQRQEPLFGGGEPYFAADVESVKRYYADGYRGAVEYCIAL